MISSRAPNQKTIRLASLRPLPQTIWDLCVLHPGRFPQLPADETVSDQGQASERCLNEGCPVIFSRARVAKQLGSAREALQRLDLKEA